MQQRAYLYLIIVLNLLLNKLYINSIYTANEKSIRVNTHNTSLY
jgi:hypothetical protein